MRRILSVLLTLGILGCSTPRTTEDFRIPALRPNPVGVSYGKPGTFGGTATWGAFDDPKTFNPALISELNSISVMWHLFDGLCEENGDTLEVRPALASKWNISQDGLHYTFTLRKNLQWSDGKPLTADDVVFTFRDVMFNPKIPANADSLKIPIDAQTTRFPSIRRIDGQTVEFSLPKPYAPFLRALAAVFVLPKHCLEKSVFTLKGGVPEFNQTWGIDTPVRKIVGSGPFVLEEFAPAQRVVFRRNPYYWRFDKKGKRLPYLDQLVYSFSKDISGLTLKFLSKEIDVIGARGRQYELLKPLEKTHRFHIVNAGPEAETPFLMFNLNRRRNKNGKPYVDPVKQTWFNDLRFRQACAHAIDKETIIRNAFNFVAVPQIGEYGPRHPFFSPKIRDYAYNLKTAQNLLSQAGYLKRGDRLYDPSGHPVAFDLVTFTGNPTAIQIPVIIKTDLEKLGMKVNLVPVQFNTCVEKLDNTYDWDLMYLNWTGGVEPHSSALLWRSNGSYHFFRPGQKAPSEPWEAAMDRLVDEGAVTVDPVKRQEIYTELQTLVLKEVPMIFLVAPLYLAAVRDELGNIRPNPFNAAVYSCWNSYEIYRTPSQGKRGRP